jgi:hypothetical protein
MDRYCGFVYNALIGDVLRQLKDAALKEKAA